MAGGEAATELLLADPGCGLVGDDKVDGWTDVQVSVEIVEVVDEVGFGG